MHTKYNQERSDRGSIYTLDQLVGNSAHSTDIETLQKILKDIYVKGRINDRDTNGNTALITACESGNKEAVKILLDNGAKPNVTDKHRRTAYTVLSQSDRNEEIKLMLDIALNDLRGHPYNFRQLRK